MAQNSDNHSFNEDGVAKLEWWIITRVTQMPFIGDGNDDDDDDFGDVLCKYNWAEIFSELQLSGSIVV